MYIRQNIKEPFLNNTLNIRGYDVFKISSGKRKNDYYNIPCAFDIEVTNYEDKSYMYIWQFGYYINNIQYVVKGRTWEEFHYFITTLSTKIGSSHRLIIWVHNLSFEFGFLRGRYHNHITELFCKEHDKPIKFLLFDNLEFRCSYALTNKSLAKLSKDYCTTRKLEGDLDYNILRNSKTKLTEMEENYCDNDVIILCEFHIFVINHWLINGKLPLTATGILRNEVKQFAFDTIGAKRLSKFITNNHPSKSFYDLMMRYCFMGGITHANYHYVGKTFSNFESFDITSSYPSVMLQLNYRYPLKFEQVNISNLQKYNKLNKKFVSIIVITFEDFTATTSHSLFSKSKAIEISKESVIDNGRVQYSKKITIMITNVDFEYLSLFYKWGKYDILKCWKAKTTNLPDYLLKPLINAYNQKAILKKKKLSYENEKVKVNTGYGMTIQRMILNEEKYDNESDTFVTKNAETFYDQVKKGFLLPQWGVFITAYARRNLAMAIWYNYDDVAYYDTDSVKGNFSTKCFDYMRQYNKKILMENIKLANKFDIPLKSIYNLGMFDRETKKNNYSLFKTLGAKRYIYVQNDKFHQTIAGLGKNALYNEVAKNYNLKETELINKCFEIFDNGMNIKETNKLRTIRNYNYHSDIIDNEIMCEYSSIALVPVEFTLKIESAFFNLYTNYQKSIKNLEKR